MSWTWTWENTEELFKQLLDVFDPSPFRISHWRCSWDHDDYWVAWVDTSKGEFRVLLWRGCNTRESVKLEIDPPAWLAATSVVSPLSFANLDADKLLAHKPLLKGLIKLWEGENERSESES